VADAFFQSLPELMCAVGVVVLVASVAHGRREARRRRKWRDRPNLPSFIAKE
jgi:hypothetical protein